MTIQQQAYGLIDRLSEDSIQAVIQVMKRMLPNEGQKTETEERLKLRLLFILYPSFGIRPESFRRMRAEIG